jgi:lysophospholipase L1-like esterase
MRNEKGGMREGLSKDGIHPESAGYSIMEPLIKSAVNKALSKK